MTKLLAVRSETVWTRLASVLLLLGLAAVGCGNVGAGSSTTTGSGPADAGPLVTYTRSGGFAPVLEEMRIERDGSVALTKGLGGPDREPRRFELTPEELTTLTDALADAPLEQVTRGNGACADCFEYTVETDGAKVTSSEFDLDPGSGSEVPPAIDDLYALLAGILADHNGREPTIGA